MTCRPSVELAQASDAAKIWLDKIRADDTSLRRLPASGAIEKTRLIREGKLIKCTQILLSICAALPLVLPVPNCASAVTTSYRTVHII